MTSTSRYGQVHYFTFHRILPTKLFDSGLISFIKSCESKRQGAMILKLWGETEFEVSAKSFPLLFDDVFEKYRLIVIGLPPPEETPQGRLIAVWFETRDPDSTLRYFVSEKPVEDELFGDVLGEWSRDGSHRNFGPYCLAGQVTVGTFVAAIQKHCGFTSTGHISSKKNVDESKTNSPVQKSNDNQSAMNRDRVRQEVRKRIAKRTDALQDTDRKATHRAVPTEDPEKLIWQSNPSEIATDAVARLRNMQQIGKSVMILSAETAEGLQSIVSTYLQFKIINKKKVLVEVQGDYSYWGVSVPSGEWHNFATLGFSTPSSINGNFSITYKDLRDDEPLKVWLSQVIQLMQQVIKPRGDIGIRFF